MSFYFDMQHSFFQYTYVDSGKITATLQGVMLVFRPILSTIS